MKYLKLFKQYESVNFKQYDRGTIKGLEKLIGIVQYDSGSVRLENGYWHGYLLSLLPDNYTNVKFSFKTDKGGWGYVGAHTQIGDTLKQNGIEYSQEVLQTDIGPELWVHELWHFFTQPVLVMAMEKGEDRCPAEAWNYAITMQNLYNRAKKLGYSAKNELSVHENLNEFVVNITNISSVKKLQRLGLWKEYFECQKKWFESIKNSSEKRYGR